MDKDFYSKYVSTHTANLYGETGKFDAQRNFVAWNSYFDKWLPKNKEAKILDAGCGKGDFVFWLIHLGFNNVRGIDISAEQIVAGKKSGFTNIYEDDVFDELSRNANGYDVVIARDILEHFTKDDSVKFVKSIASTLTSDGIFIIQTVNAENLLWGRLRYGDFTHEQAFTETSIRQLLLVAGFRDIMVFPQRPVVHGVKSLFRYVIWRFFELLFRFYLLIETGSSRGIFTQNILAIAKK